MKRREDERNVDENLWDKTFEDNQDLGRDGHLSRLEHRKQSSAASRFTTILVVLIIILAATPVLYWINHEKSFNHPTPKLEQVAKGSTEHKKKVASSSSTASQKRSAATKLSRAKDSSSTRAHLAASATQSAAESSSSSSASSVNRSDASYVQVQAGQGIYRVAVNNGLTVEQLAQLNGISPTTKLYPGQQLRVK